jgi:hypothetical protein
VSWPEIIAEWPRLEFDFHAILGVDLSTAIFRESFRWFATRVTGILSHRHSMLAAHFAPDEDPSPTPDMPID